MQKTMSVWEIMRLIHPLSPSDKSRLIQQIALAITKDLQARPKQSRQSLRGILKGSPITADEIAVARQEMWGDFPREDFLND